MRCEGPSAKTHPTAFPEYTKQVPLTPKMDQEKTSRVVSFHVLLAGDRNPWFQLLSFSSFALVRCI